MTTFLAPADLELAAQENVRLRAQVKRLQQFAFRDLLAATPEELSDAVDSLTPQDRACLSRHLFGSLTDRSVAPATVADDTDGGDDDTRAIAWRIKAGTLERLRTAR